VSNKVNLRDSEEFEETKGVIRSRKLEDMQHKHGQRKKDIHVQL